MKIILTSTAAIGIAAAILYFQPAITRRQTAPKKQPAPALAAQPQIAKTATYRSVLNAPFSAMMSTPPKALPSAEELAQLRTAFTSIAQSPERDAALRLCALFERGIQATDHSRKRIEKPPLRTIPDSMTGAERDRLEKEIDQTEAFFRKGIESDWLKAMAQIQTAALAEWERIPAAAAAPQLAPLAETQSLAANSETLYVQITANGTIHPAQWW